MTQDQKPPDTEEKEPIRVSFSLPQITGGALAAATAAAIGSQLGVAGTILGAAVASIVGGVAGTLYSAGLDRTHRKVSEAISRGYDQVRSAEDYDPDAGPVLLDQAHPTLPGLDQQQGADAAGHSPVASPAVTSRERRRRLWKMTGLSVAAMFVLALVAITVIELGLGRSLDGRNGTTISQVVREPRSTTPTPAPTPSTTTPAPTLTPTPTPTPAVSDQPTTPAPESSEPTATAPTALAPPTAAVSEAPTPASTP